MTSLSLLTPDLSVSEVHDGIVIEPRTPLPEPAPTILHWLDRWAAERPDQIFLAERGVGGEWRKVSYAEAAQVLDLPLELRKIVGVAAFLTAFL